MRSLSLVVALLVVASTAGAQTRTVSLEDAIAMADRSSEAIDIARAAVARANGQQLVARSQFLPQLNLQASYARTLASQFEGFSFGGGDTTTNPFQALCTPEIPSTATPAERQAALDQARTCAAPGGGGADFQSVGFGALNQWTLGLQFSQSIFSGGRNTGTRNAANAGRRSADIELTAQRAQLVLDVTQAYYNTVLASRLADIAQSTLRMSEDVLRQTTRARQVGSSSEFELIRAQVGRDNQVPVMLQRMSERDIALLRLKQLLEIPLDDSLVLTTSIDEEPVNPMRIASDTSGRIAADTLSQSRATVRQARENVLAQEGLLRVARSDRWPSLAITSGYQRLFFPQDVFPQFTDYRENWTIGITANVALLSGGRIRGSVLQAQANLREARARHEQALELAALDSRIALSQLTQAEAVYRASQGTAEQARRAYSIDEIRYREGISTQTDLTQSRLLVEQAMVNRAVAARDLAVARMRLALLKDLPLSAPSMGSIPQAGALGNLMTPTPQAPGAAVSAPISGSNQQ